MATRKKKNVGGRPKAITETVLRKLEEGFLRGLNVTQCCLFAEVPKSTYYDYLNAHPDYSDRIELLKSNTGMIAILNVHDEIKNGDVNTSKWYLERTSEEFNPKQKQELTGKDGNPIEVQSTVQIYLPDNQREDKPKE